MRPALAAWVDDVARWDFKVISPSHFGAGKGSPADLRAAFAPTLADNAAERAKRPYAAADVKLLDDTAGGLRAVKII